MVVDGKVEVLGKEVDGVLEVVVVGRKAGASGLNLNLFVGSELQTVVDVGELQRVGGAPMGWR